MKQIFFLITILFLCMGLSGQGQFFPGYYISNQGDTIQGYIENQKDVQNAKACHFRTEKDTKTRVFLPGEIRAYHINDFSYYRSLELSVDNESKTLFAEFLVDGIVDFYYLHFNHKVHYYIQSDDKKFLELPKPETISREGSNQSNKVSVDNRFRGIIKYYMSDQPELFETIDKLKFDAKDFIGIACKYHKLTARHSSECQVFRKKRHEFQGRYSIGINYKRTSFSTKSDAENNKYDGIEDNEFGCSMNYHLVIPHFSKHLMFSTGLNLKMKYYEQTTTDLVSYNYTKDTYLGIKLLHLGPEFEVRYKFYPYKKIKPYINATYLYDYEIWSSVNKIDIYHISGDDTPLEKELSPPTIQPRFSGYKFGIGARFSLYSKDDMSFQVNYLYKIDRYNVNWNSKITGIVFGLNYYL